MKCTVNGTVVAIDPNWDVTPTRTVTYLVLGAPPATGAVQAELGRLDVAVSSRAAIADYTTARAAKLDNLDATISSRSAPATAQTIDQTTALPGSPVAGSVGEALKRADTNCDATVWNLENGKKLNYSLLVPHLIERYGFYEGKGTPYRVEPRAILEVFDFLKPAKQR